MKTAGEARQALVEAHYAARKQTREKRLQQLGESAQLTALECFNDGFTTGYAAGFQMALEVVRGQLNDAIDAQRTGIMSRWP